MPERWLYLPVGESLADWEASQPPPFEAARIVGDEYEARAHALREVLSRIGVPFRFIPTQSAEGRALRTGGATCSRGATSTRRHGRSSVRRCSWRRACRACSRPATCVT